ncbi:MAG: GNAT family N-acetyltransferase [Pseudomonadota bacterium]
MKPEATETIWRDGAVRLELSPFVSDEWLDYVTAVWFGDAARRYQRRNVREQVARFENPRFLSLRYAGKLIGTYLIDLQSLSCDGQPVTGFYRGLLAVDATFRSQHLGSAITDAALEWIRQQTTSGATLTYGCIDEHNKRSITLLTERGMQSLAVLRQRLFYRQFKRQPLATARVTEGLTDNALADLTASSEHTVTPASWRYGNWITVDDNSTRRIAARFAVNELALAPMTGITGFVINRLMPLFPPGRRRFNPHAFRYISISDPVNGAGPKASWDALIEHLMVIHDCHFVCLISDAEDPSGNALLDSGALGGKARDKASTIGIFGQWLNALERPDDIRFRLAARDL